MFASSGAFAAAVSGPESVAITVYNSDLALIRETRSFTLAGGAEVIEITDVSGQLNPATVHFGFTDGSEFQLLEQNYDFDLVNTDELLRKFTGKTVKLVDASTQQTLTGRLLSASAGTVLEAPDGSIFLNPPGRFVLPQGAADGLLLRPTLSWLIDAAAGAHTGEISYLSGGLSWQADYVLHLNSDTTAGAIEGWVTLSNYSGTTYKDAQLRLVAGEVNRVVDEEPRLRTAAVPEAMPAPAAAFQEEQLFEYHLYGLQYPTTLRNSQVKQIGLLQAAAVPLTKQLYFDGINGGDVSVYVKLRNEEAAGLGMPLPEGTVRVFQNDRSGAAQFIGEDRIKHTPKDEEVKLKLGNAFDIVGETTRQTYSDRKDGWDGSWLVKLRNHKREDVLVIVTATLWGEWKVTQSSLPYQQQDAFTIEFQVHVPAEGSSELSYNVSSFWR